MILSRRRALFGLLAAPAIVAAPSLMRVKVLPPKETLEQLLARKIRSAEAQIRAELDDLFDRMYCDGSSDAPDGLQTLLTEDASAVGGIDRTVFQWWDSHGSITYYGRG